MSKISVDVEARLALGISPNARVDPTQEQLQVVFDACLKALSQMGELASRVEVIKAYYFQVSRDPLPELLYASFEVVVVVDSATNRKFQVRASFFGANGMHNDLARLLMGQVKRQLSNHLKDEETRQHELSDMLAAMQPVAA